MDWSQCLDYYWNENMRLDYIGALCSLLRCCCFCRSTWCHWRGWRVGVCLVDYNCDIPCQAANTLPEPGSIRLDVFPSPMSRPVGSFVAGTLARLSDLHMALLIWWWQVGRPVLLLHDSPWVPHEVTGESVRVRPKRRPTATRMTSSVRGIDRMRWLEAQKGWHIHQVGNTLPCVLCWRDSRQNQCTP